MGDHSTYQTSIKKIYIYISRRQSSLVVQQQIIQPVQGDMGSIPGSGRFSGGGSGNPLQYPYLRNPMDRGA